MGIATVPSRDRPRAPYGPPCCKCGDEVMGLFGAMTSAVSGLQAQAFAMQNISGNIANSQTIAYKGINTSFEELIPGVSVAIAAIRRRRVCEFGRNQHQPGRHPEHVVEHRDGDQRRRLLHRSIAARLYRQHAELRRRRRLYAPRRLRAQRARLPGQRRRLLSRRHADRPDDRQSDRHRRRSLAIPEQLFAG